MTDDNKDPKEKDKFKDTVFLPKTEFPMRGGLPQKEPEILAGWQEMDLYAKMRENAKGREKWILHDGPPYANGDIHMGHAVNKILKDVVVKSYAMLGYDTPYVPGWDCHGLPIEWKIEEKYREAGKDKDEVDKLAFRAECRQFAQKWVDIQADQFQRLGVSGDWSNPYLTMTHKAEASIVREIHKFVKNGGLYKGAKPVLWSVVEKTALAEAEVEYKEHKSVTVWVRFPVAETDVDLLKGADIVIWTTTPWTLPSNRALAYGADLEYGVYEISHPLPHSSPPLPNPPPGGGREERSEGGGVKLAIATALADSVKEAANIEEWECLGTFKGSELAGTVCAHPLRGQGYDFDVPALEGDFVTDDAGTGFVHIAPGHGEDDFYLGTANGVEVTDNVADDGTFRDHVPLFAGLEVYTQKGELGPGNFAVLKELKEVGKLLAKGSMRHEYPHSWRSKAPLIFRTTPQWFIGMDLPPLPNPPPGGGREEAAKAAEGGGVNFSPDLHYKKADKPKLASVDAGRKGLKAVVTADDEGGRYAWKVLAPTLAYAASLVGEIAESIFDIDEAMKLGYNWKMGPFEMIDQLGPAWFVDKLKEDGHDVPEILAKVADGSFYKTESGKAYFFGLDGKYHEIIRPEGVLLLRDIKLGSEPVLANGSAKVWDIGDGALCFEQTSKMNTFDDKTFELLNKTIKLVESEDAYKALVIYNEASHFSAGANLGLALFMINIALYPQVEEFIGVGQKTFMALKYAGFPVVSAPSGMALGGGCEVCLAADAIQAHAETYTGLVEVGVGVIPGWGGCKEMILRLQERERAKFKADVGKVEKDGMWFSPDTTPMGAVRKAFETIGMATVAKSAHEAIDIGYFRESDGVTMNRDRLLFDAKQRALELAKDYTAPEKAEEIRLPGETGRLALEMAVKDLQKSGKATPYDGVVSRHLAEVLSGGEQADWTKPITEDDLLKLELEQFSALIRNEGTMDRIEHMLETGKPLRN